MKDTKFANISVTLQRHSISGCSLNSPPSLQFPRHSKVLHLTRDTYRSLHQNCQTFRLFAAILCALKHRGHRQGVIPGSELMVKALSTSITLMKIYVKKVCTGRKNVNCFDKEFFQRSRSSFAHYGMMFISH